jgi:hypothetical protein
MKTITQPKPKKKLSAFFDQFIDTGSRATGESETQSELVSVVIRSGQLVDAPKNNNELAEIKTDYFHTELNSFIENGVAFDVSSDDFLFIDTAQTLKLSDMEFLKLNHSIVLCTLQQSLLMKHLFSHSPEQFEDFAFEILEREAIFSEVSTNSPLTITDKTPFEIYFEAVKSITHKWFAELLEKKA